MNSISSTSTLQGRCSRSTSTKLQNEGLETGGSTHGGKYVQDQEMDSGGSEDTGRLSDHDERNGDERRYAKESPIKGKQRLTSKVCISYQLSLSINQHVSGSRQGREWRIRDKGPPSSHEQRPPTHACSRWHVDQESRTHVVPLVSGPRWPMGPSCERLGRSHTCH